MKNNSPRRRWSIEKRLEFIDFQLFWRGIINRADIRKQFGVSMPQASSDLNAYQESARNNLFYDLSEKRYLAADGFKPAFITPDSDAYLWMMRDDVAALTGSSKQQLYALPPHDIIRLPKRRIVPEILRQVVFAINEKNTLQILYQSMSSDEPTWRFISPHSFAFDGLRWHVRSFCHTKHQYKDFLLSRIQELGEEQTPYVSGDNDEEWNTTCTVVLKPHPKLSSNQARAVAQDFNMTDMKLTISMRLAFLYYFLRRLELQDCDGESRNPREQHVVIHNKDEIKRAMKKLG